MPTIARTYLARSGPSRREYQRAHYRARQLAAHPVLPAPPPPEPADENTEVGELHHQYLHGPNPDTAANYLAALLAAGNRLAAAADHAAAQRITELDCEPVDYPAGKVTAARTLFTEQQSRWLQIDRQVRRELGLPADHELTDEQLFPDHLPLSHQRWRRAARTDYEYARTDFLELAAATADHDRRRQQRHRVRRDSYLNQTGPVDWIDTNPCLPVPARWSCPPSHCAADTLRHVRATRPAIGAAVDLFVAARARNPVAGPVRNDTATLLTEGALAVFTGTRGGLIGDCYRTSDLTLRALIVGVWALL